MQVSMYLADRGRAQPLFEQFLAFARFQQREEVPGLLAVEHERFRMEKRRERRELTDVLRAAFEQANQSLRVVRFFFRVGCGKNAAKHDLHHL
jgi:hypothetical protein